MIDFQNVTKLYGKVIGVNDVTLSLQPGAYGLLGPNGSGKSTLINLIMGQLKPTIGSVHVFGECPTSNDDLYQQMGYCPSSEGMYASVTGFEWVRYLLRLQGMKRRHATDAAKQALELVGMTNAMDRLISGYSRGMRQRTKMAQAISHDPKLLILDEPFNGLDPIGRHEMTIALQNWIESGKSLLLASHVLHEVESVTQSFLLICGGRLLASGHAHEVNQLLVDLPNDLTIRCSAPKRLAEAIVARDMAESLKIEADQLIASTRHPSRILAELPTWVTHNQIEIYEIRSADESLQELFNSLLKIHRGEI